MLVKCDECNKQFERETRHVNYNKKMNRRTLCSRSCAGKQWCKTTRVKRMSKISAAQREVLYLLQQAKHNSRTRKKEFNLTLDYVLSLWQNQKYLCAITNKPMSLRESRLGESTPYQASIDRIDSNQGYVIGNVQLVCLAANLAKHTFTNDQILKFFQT